jgi:hypothetical protein
MCKFRYFPNRVHISSLGNVLPTQEFDSNVYDASVVIPIGGQLARLQTSCGWSSAATPA